MNQLQDPSIPTPKEYPPQSDMSQVRPPFSHPGYQDLAKVLEAAFDQAAYGKGHERHAIPGETFREQFIFDMAKRYGKGSLIGQAAKKAEESQRLGLEGAYRELLGAIVYLGAAAIVTLEQLGRQEEYLAKCDARATARRMEDEAARLRKHAAYIENEASLANETVNKKRRKDT